jgi:hypothetical protein
VNPLPGIRPEVVLHSYQAFLFFLGVLLAGLACLAIAVPILAWFVFRLRLLYSNVNAPPKPRHAALQDDPCATILSHEGVLPEGRFPAQPH